MIDFKTQHEAFAMALLGGGVGKGSYRRFGQEIRGRCPLSTHQDQTPSFGYNVEKGSYACSCGAGVGSDLWKLVGWAPPKNGNGHHQPSQEVAAYDYRDESGALLFQVVRLVPKGFRQRHPCQQGRNGWTWNLGGNPSSCPCARIRRVIYRLPEVLKSAGPVLVVEGERDADTAWRLGFVGTCNPMGASKPDQDPKWRDEYSDSLKGREVYIIPDNDPPGECHAKHVQRSLTGKARVAVILPPFEGAKDLSEWVEKGATAEQLRAVIAKHKPEGLSVGNSSIVSSVSGQSEPDYEEPIPFKTYPVPEFPTEIFPGWLKAWVEGEAAATETPVDMAGLLAFGILSTVSAKRLVVQVADQWREPVNIYCLVALPTGNLKSPVFSHARDPIEAYRDDHLAEWREAYQIDSSRYDVAAQALKRAKDEAAKAPGDKRDEALAEVDRLARELERTRKPFMPRFTADNVTPEKLTSLLAEQRGRIAVLSAEGGFFSILQGRYSEGMPDLDTVLKGYSGELIQTDRQSRASEFIRNPALTICLAIQNQVLDGLTENEEFRERGLLARFFYSVPHSLVGYRKLEAEPVNAAVRDAYQSHVRAILQLPEAEVEQTGELVPVVVTLTEVGKAMLTEFRKKLEPRLRDDGDLAPIRDWCSKAHGALLRIAGLLHMAESIQPGAKAIPPVIADETLDKAIRLMEYLIPHALAAYGRMDQDPAVELAERILTWVKSSSRRKGCEKEGLDSAYFTRRQTHRHLNSSIRKVEELDAPLKLLAAHGYIRPLDRQEKDGPGRPVSQSFQINPGVICPEKCRQNRQNPQEPPHSVDSVITSRPVPEPREPEKAPVSIS